MKLSDFLKLNNPIEYNFEFENKLLAESGLDTYSRYFTYKANNDNVYVIPIIILSTNKRFFITIY